MTCWAQAAVIFQCAQPLRFEHNAAQLSDPLTEIRPGSSRITPRTCPADTIALLNIAWFRIALVPVNTPAAVIFQCAQPLRFEHNAAQLSDPLTEVLPGSSRIFSCTRPADSHALLDTAWSRTALMPVSAPASMRLIASQPLRFEHNAAQLSYPLTEVIPNSGRTISCACPADPHAFLNRIRSRAALMPSGAPASMRSTAAQPLRFEHNAAQLSDPLAEGVPGSLRERVQGTWHRYYDTRSDTASGWDGPAIDWP
jgi:hypothetical protein